jgi:hypothetical protein
MTLEINSNPHSKQMQNNAFGNTNHYKKGLELAEAGRHRGNSLLPRPLE